jgi:hypothetical protein
VKTSHFPKSRTNNSIGNLPSILSRRQDHGMDRWLDSTPQNDHPHSENFKYLWLGIPIPRPRRTHPTRSHIRITRHKPPRTRRVIPLISVIQPGSIPLIRSKLRTIMQNHFPRYRQQRRSHSLQFLSALHDSRILYDRPCGPL